MSIFDLIGQAGAGFTRGLAQAEQLKYGEREKKQARSEGLQYRRQQMELALRKQQFEEDQAKGAEVAGLRQYTVKALNDMEQHEWSDPNFKAQRQAAGTWNDYLAHKERLRQIASNPAARTEDFIQGFAEKPEAHAGILGVAQPPAPQDQAGDYASAQPAQAPAPMLQRPPNMEPGNFPGMGQPLPNAGGLQRGDVSPMQAAPAAPPRLMRPEAPGLVPQQQPSPGLSPPAAPQFTPDFLAKVERDKAGAAASTAAARKSNAGAAIDEAKGPYAGPQAAADLAHTGASTHLANTQANTLGGRLQLDKSRFDESIRQADREYALASGNAAQKEFLDQKTLALQTFIAYSTDALRQAQAGLMGEQLKKLVQEMQAQAKINPAVKPFIDAINASTVHTQFGDYVDQYSANALADMFDGYGTGLGEIIRKHAGGAPHSFTQMMQGQGVDPNAAAAAVGTPGAGPSLVPPGGQRQGPIGTMTITPSMPAGGLPPTAGLAPAAVGISPEMARHFEDNRRRFESGDYAPSSAAPKRKGKQGTRTKTEAKPQAAAKPGKSNPNRGPWAGGLDKKPAAFSTKGRTPEQEKRYQELLKKQGK